MNEACYCDLIHYCIILFSVDILSHGLWGSVVFGRKNRASFWLAFLFGILPDFLAFGWYFAGTFLGIFDHPNFASGQHPAPDSIPSLVFSIYQVTHSLVIFLICFLVVWYVCKRPIWELFAWALHIVFDIPTHTPGFFPTPFLCPFAGPVVDGVSWASPIIFIPNIVLLVVLYSHFVWKRYQYKKNVLKKAMSE